MAFCKSGMVFRRYGPNPCPYLPDRLEHQVFSVLGEENAQEDFENLSLIGFRRSQTMIYRPACTSCQSCISVRVRARDFVPTSSQRRIIKRNRDLKEGWQALYFNDALYDLFHAYVQSRHGDGPMAEMSYGDCEEMLGKSVVNSRLFILYAPSGEILAVCLVDLLALGFSAVYSFFSPNYPKRSLGSYIILRLIERAKVSDKGYVYLGYWVSNSPKMNYKRHFMPLEGYIKDKWQELDFAR